MFYDDEFEQGEQPTPDKYGKYRLFRGYKFDSPQTEAPNDFLARVLQDRQKRESDIFAQAQQKNRDAGSWINYVREAPYFTQNKEKPSQLSNNDNLSKAKQELARRVQNGETYLETYPFKGGEHDGDFNTGDITNELIAKNLLAGNPVPSALLPEGSPLIQGDLGQNDANRKMLAASRLASQFFAARGQTSPHLTINRDSVDLYREEADYIRELNNQIYQLQTKPNLTPQEAQQLKQLEKERVIGASRFLYPSEGGEQVVPNNTVRLPVWSMMYGDLANIFQDKNGTFAPMKVYAQRYTPASYLDAPPALEGSRYNPKEDLIHYFPSERVSAVGDTWTHNTPKDSQYKRSQATLPHESTHAARTRAKKSGVEFKYPIAKQILGRAADIAAGEVGRITPQNTVSFYPNDQYTDGLHRRTEEVVADMIGASQFNRRANQLTTPDGKVHNNVPYYQWDMRKSVPAQKKKPTSKK